MTMGRPLFTDIVCRKAELDRLRAQRPHGLTNLEHVHDIEITYASNALPPATES